MGKPEIDLSGLVASMEYELETEFPRWLISRETSGRWVAVRPNWGSLYADNAPELRERLRKYDADAAS
ncbi:hypothetical protein amrb99_46990 [Actinomadura sp. RB99]|uniref:hypothetical protein n=1 Tax=Actinomadura sp. RB99 TaxID=2691577 RepID=UPI001682904D|nr:hypothetical protein [Actinomadura sp. RB99]MBD2895760.1 hypothetical protein [Actinomadura sp. RB99]